MAGPGSCLSGDLFRAAPLPRVTWRHVSARFSAGRVYAKKRRDKQLYQGPGPSNVPEQPQDELGDAKPEAWQVESFQTSKTTDSLLSTATSRTTEHEPLPASTRSAPPTLPAVSRERVITACIQVSGIIAAVGLLLRVAAPYISPAVGDGQEESVLALLQWPSSMTLPQLGWSLGVAGAVTGARATLLQLWPEFQEASDTSNRQVLSPLQPIDLLLVAALPGIAEELLFRGGLVPAIYPDWKGVLIAGATFGVLHNNGGRNPAFSLWASVVGCTYGCLFLSTQNLYTAMLAHSLANLASGVLWLRSDSVTTVENK